MNREQKRMLINLMILTDEYDLLKQEEQSNKDYKEAKKNAYYKLTRFIATKGDK